MHYGTRVAAIFDLDYTITRRDTYLRFLFSYLHHHPKRMLRCGWLLFALAAHKLKIRDNSWLKQTFLQAVTGGAERAEIHEWVQGSQIPSFIVHAFPIKPRNRHP